MKVILFGATGMIGQGVLRECLLDGGVREVVAVGRSASGQSHPKLRDLVLADLTDYSSATRDLARADACFYCLGVASAGMSEADYRRVTYDIAVAAAKALVAESPAATFVFVSGAGTDAASGRMWARVKGETENAVLALPFKAAYAFRPGFIQPLDGIRSRTPLYRVLYTVTTPLFPVLKALVPRHLLTTRAIGRAMLKAARDGAPKRVLEAPDINALAA